MIWIAALMMAAQAGERRGPLYHPRPDGSAEARAVQLQLQGRDGGFERTNRSSGSKAQSVVSNTTSPSSS